MYNCCHRQKSYVIVPEDFQLAVLFVINEIIEVGVRMFVIIELRVEEKVPWEK